MRPYHARMTEQTQTPAAEPGARPPKAPAPRINVLHVLATSMRVTKQNFVPFFVIACVVSVPSMLLELSSATDDALLAFVLDTMTHALATGIVAYGAIMELYGSRPSARACIAKGVSNLGRVVGVSLITTLAIFAAALLLVIPGIIVAVMFYVVVPVAVVEDLGIDASIKRSRELTHGHKSHLFLIALLGFGVGVGIELVAHYELTAEAAFVWRAVTGALTTMFFSVTTAVVYVELRRLREGVQLPEIATAFARIRKQP
jgi:hypothetical protein